MTWNQVLAHLVGDYLFQTDWMAKNKKNDWFVCLVHITCYMIPWIIGATFWWSIAWWQLLLIGAQHYIQDRSNFVKWYLEHADMKGFAKPPMAPWSIIIVDNIFHLLWITIVLSL